MIERTIFILVFILLFTTKYTTYKDQKNCAKLRISGLLLNENFKISLTKLNSIKHTLQTHYMYSTLPHRFNVEYTWCVCEVSGNQNESRKNQLCRCYFSQEFTSSGICAYYLVSWTAITCSKLTIKKPERRHWHRSSVFIVNFEHISHLALVFLLLTLWR